MALIATGVGTWRHKTELDIINSLQKEFLAYSYLYYHCDMAVVPDTYYDQMAGWLVNHATESPKDWSESLYRKYLSIDETVSLFELKEAQYPMSVKLLCIKILDVRGIELPEILETL